MFSVERQALGRENNIGDLGNGSPTPLNRVLQCYTAWPACTESRSRVLQKVLQSATQGATFFTALGSRDQPALDYSTENSEKPSRVTISASLSTTARERGATRSISGCRTGYSRPS